MIKTVKGVMSKLTTARDMGYKYCKVAVDNNNIGCALISDILDSITYCHTPGGKIRTFIHRGYEYTVEDGIEITILTNEEFLEHYIGLPCNKDIIEKAEDKVRRDVLEAMMQDDGSHLTKEETDYLNGILGLRDARRNTIKAKTNPVKEPEPSDLSCKSEEVDGKDSEAINPKDQKEKEGIFSRIKHWLKGDVKYKK